MPAGRVSATPDKAPAAEHYDVVVLGVGLLGAAVGALLRRWAPAASLLLVEADGIPNEAGATVASPGLVPPENGSEQEAASSWALDWLASEGIGGATSSTGWLHIGAARGDGPPPAPLASVLDPDTLVAVMGTLGVDRDHPAQLAPGGYLPAEETALSLARTAVRDGADLVLNARAAPRDGRRIVLERLALNRRMELGVHARQSVEADIVVVACGAAGGDLAEAGLDRPVRVESRYQQFPRVRWPAGVPTRSGTHRPVLGLAGWALRPVAGGALLVPPSGAPDPVGYRPVAGRLLGVPVGLRREILEALLDEPALAGLVGSGRLDLGKSIRSVRGARFGVTPDGTPLARSLGDGWWLLSGGSVSVLRDVAAAAEVAAMVAGVDRPW